MIDEETKQRLIQEIEKSGNVYLSCMKVNINKATYYRWLKEDSGFKKKAKQAEKIGRENNCDIAKHALMLNVKDKKMDAIKYVLSHNSPEYKPNEKRVSNVMIVHKKDDGKPTDKKETFEDYIDRVEIEHKKEAIDDYNWIMRNNKKLPNKPNGSPIPLFYFPDYFEYIKDWCFMNDIKKQESGLTWRELEFYDTDKMSFDELAELIDTEDSKSDSDKHLEEPQENQRLSNNQNSNSAMKNKPPDNST